MEEPPKRRFRASTLVILAAAVAFVAAVLVIVVVFAGDDDDGSSANGTPTEAGTPATADPNASDLTQYIGLLEDLGTTLDDRISDLQTQLNEDLAVTDDEADRLELVKQNFIDTGAATKEFISGLEDINPPASVAQPHTGMVEAGRTYTERYDEIAEELEAVTEFSDVEAIIRDPDFEETRSAFIDKCAAVATTIEGLGEPVVFFC